MGISRLTPACYSRQADGLRLAVRLTPKGGRDGFEGVRPTAQTLPGAAGAELCARVTAVPEKGRANAALLKLLGKALKLPGTAFSIVAGDTDRHKQVFISGDPARLADQLDAWLATLQTR